MAALTALSSPPPPPSLEDLCRRMVMCNLRGSLQPLGNEQLENDQTLGRLEAVLFREWLPSFADRGDVKRQNQLIGQIKKFFDGREESEKIDALARKILAREEKAAEAGLLRYFELGAEERFQLLYTMHPAPRTIPEKMKRCQLIQSVLLKESEFYGCKAVAYTIKEEAARIESGIQGDHIEKIPGKRYAMYSFDFSLPKGADFDDFCFVLHLRLIQDSIDALWKASKIKGLNGIDERALRVLDQETAKLRSLMGAVSERHPSLAMRSQQLLHSIELRRLQMAYNRAGYRSGELAEVTPFPDSSIRLSEFGPPLIPVTVMEDKEGLSSQDAAKLYFARRGPQEALYRRAREEWTQLAAASRQNPFKFSTNLFPNPRYRILPEALPAPSPDPNRLDVILDELLHIEKREEPAKPKETRKKPKQKPPAKKEPVPKSYEAEEKKPESPVQALAYAPRVERWFSASPHDSLDSAQFPEYAGMAGNPLRMICYHAFPVEVDAYLDDALKQVWINTASGHPDEQYVLPAEFELPDEDPVRGAISYAIGVDGVCYHRYFHPMDSAELIEKFGLHRFEKSDFPELSAETQKAGAPTSCRQPAQGRIIEENPALGTVSIRDERTGAIIRLFRGN